VIITGMIHWGPLRQAPWRKPEEPMSRALGVGREYRPQAWAAATAALAPWSV